MAHFHDHSVRPSLKQPEEALALFDRALACFRRLEATPRLMIATDLQATPGDPSALEWVRHNIANVHSGRALVHLRLSNHGAAQAEIELAAPFRAMNLQASPGNVTWRQSLMFDQQTSANALLGQGRGDQALIPIALAWQTALALLAEAGPGSPWEMTLANMATPHARALMTVSRWQEAAQICELGAQQLQSAPSTQSSKEALHSLLALAEQARAELERLSVAPRSPL